MKVRLTKTTLRYQQMKLHQLTKYLPTLKLKKALLQSEIDHTEAHIAKWMEDLNKVKKKIMPFAFLFQERWGGNYLQYVQVQHVEKHYENIAGVDIPVFENVVFKTADYHLFDTPIWLDQALEQVKMLIKIKEHIEVEKEKKMALEKEWKDVSTRVNLFERILIPRTEKLIKKIQVFLADQQLAAISQAKVAKEKILQSRGEVA